MMVVFFSVFEFPENFKGYEHTPPAQLQDRFDVGLERIADHYQFLRNNPHFFTDDPVLLLGFVRNYLDVIEVLCES